MNPKQQFAGMFKALEKEGIPVPAGLHRKRMARMAEVMIALAKKPNYTTAREAARFIAGLDVGTAVRLSHMIQLLDKCLEVEVGCLLDKQQEQELKKQAKYKRHPILRYVAGGKS